MKPSELYQQQLALAEISVDDRQQALVAELDNIYHALQDPEVSWLSRWLGKQNRSTVGLYIHGDTGRGKTWLMDIFFQSLQGVSKRRAHFASFMQDIHIRLSELPKTPDPLKRIADEIVDSVKVLCLDEFHVDDITDAMILSGLLDELFSKGLLLVTTSNIEISNLYKNGLQRDRFLPAIDLLKENLAEFHLQGENDYRKRMLAEEGIYHVTTDRAIANELLEANFSSLTGDGQWNTSCLQVNGREITITASSGRILWADFIQLCGTFRSTADYIKLAYDYEVILIGHIPVLQDTQKDQVQRFINFVDAMYDHKVKLIISAESEPETLYQGQRLEFPFQRTVSRLLEMRSRVYLQTNHLAA